MKTPHPSALNGSLRLVGPSSKSARISRIVTTQQSSNYDGYRSDKVVSMAAYKTHRHRSHPAPYARRGRLITALILLAGIACGYTLHREVQLEATWEQRTR